MSAVVAMRVNRSTDRCCGNARANCSRIKSLFMSDFRSLGFLDGLLMVFLFRVLLEFLYDLVELLRSCEVEKDGFFCDGLFVSKQTNIDRKLLEMNSFASHGLSEFREEVNGSERRACPEKQETEAEDCPEVGFPLMLLAGAFKAHRCVVFVDN